MNPEKNIQPNETIEREEQSIGEPKNVITDTFDITPEEDEQLTLEKRMAEADDEKNSLNEEYHG